MEAADTVDLTVIIPAYNEEDFIGDTVESVKVQTLMPKRVIVVDDCSEDRTGEIAKYLGADVVRPMQNTGTKAGAQNTGLQYVKTKYVMVLDADTILAPDAIEHLF